MRQKFRGSFLSITAFVLYIAGGFGVFGGIALVALLSGRDLFGWGEAKTIGYLCICVGVSLCIMGVLMLRLVSNRTNYLLSQFSKRLNS